MIFTRTRGLAITGKKNEFGFTKSWLLTSRALGFYIRAKFRIETLSRKDARA